MKRKMTWRAVFASPYHSLLLHVASEALQPARPPDARGVRVGAWGQGGGTRSLNGYSSCTGVPIRNLRIFLPGLATRCLCVPVLRAQGVYPHTLAASSSLAWPLVP